MNNPRIAFLCGSGMSSKVMFNGINSVYPISCIIIEQSASRKTLLRRRIKKFGIAKVLGQLIFMVYAKLQKQYSKKRIVEIMMNYELSNSEYPSELSHYVNSVNDDEAIHILKNERPDIVIVNGTRIIRKNVLDEFDIPFVNTHVGITPKYRGVHGAYWALVNDDLENCGVTVHLIDKGIDTGGILYQDTISPGKHDNFTTYPLLQIAKAIPLMLNAIEDFSNNSLQVKTNNLPSKLWSHPTIIEYIYNCFVKKVQ